jgi:hypothetical protein
MPKLARARMRKPITANSRYAPDMQAQLPPTEFERTIAHWRAELRQPGFCFVPAHQMRGALSQAALAQWPAFAASWHDLALDEYMADAGRYRKRRHGVFQISASGKVTRLPALPHYQSLHYNRLNGGVERWFAPITETVAESQLFKELLTRFAELIQPLATDVAHWHAEAHQFRIEPTADAAGLPTPEGIHRDGVDYVLVLMVARENIDAGITTVHLANGLEIGSFTLSRAFEAVWLDDNRLFHGVTAVHPENPELPSFRDVLVLTLRRAN